ncbi:hypothetical protein L596_015655 [Steinernema carpocapsae]|uniref:Uncharacterized protein n=1 Tax=Steinernema carpocapsae TaxID=34508 RepID=A0A4U5NFS9_STECR|nr:hypothetical protein L596_015655 [Steinernema carpocapsae]
MSWFRRLLAPSGGQKAASEPSNRDNPAVDGSPGEAETPEGQAPATCQIEANKGKFPFQKKKMIVATVGPDGKPIYSQSQMNTAMQKLKERRKARKKARQEEKQYVEYRKQEILAQFRPTVGALRSGDEAFPKRRRGTMGFGERKAYYLSIRPNPKYAHWIGKKKEKIRQAKISSPLPQMPTNITDHSAPHVPEQSKREVEKEPDSTAAGKGKEEGKAADVKTDDVGTKTEEPKSTAGDKEKASPGTASTPVKSPKKKEKKKKKEKAKKSEKSSTPKGNNAANPLINGVPFWMSAGPADQDEITDDDLPIDMEILEKVCNGELTLAQRPHVKNSFNPFGPIQRMKYDDALFVRDTCLFANTVESVLGLQPETEDKNKSHPPVTKLITWYGRISVTTFEPGNRMPKEKRKPVIEALKDLRREKKAAK